MDAGGAVAVLVGAAKLEVDTVFTVEVEEVVALNQSVGKFGVRDAGAALADAVLNELAVEKLSHRESFANFAEEREVVHILKPVEVVKEDGLVGVDDFFDLFFDARFVMLDFVE